MYIYGCINPAGLDDDYDGTLLTETDMQRACNELVGKPILMEHQGPALGAIDSVWIRDADKRLMMVGHTFNNTVHGRFAENMMGDGTWAELSLSTTVPIDMQTLTTGRKTFNEVSIVEKGLRDGTTIDRIDRSKTSSGLYMKGATAKATVRCSAKRAPMSSDTSAMVTSDDQKTDEKNQMQVEERAASQTTDITQMNQDDLLRRIAELTAQVEKNKAEEQRMKFLEEKTKRTYTHAFNAFAEKYLENLKVDDEAAKNRFIEGLRHMTKDPALAGEEGDAVLQVVCAASRQHETQKKELEQAYQDLKEARQQNEEREKKRKVPRNFEETQAREQPNQIQASKPAPAQTAVRASQAARDGTGMAGTNPKLFQWLVSGQNKNQVGMPRFDNPNLRGREFAAAQ